MIHLSQTAANEIRRMQASRGCLDTRLRIRTQDGGCSGLYYILELETPGHPDTHGTLPEDVEVTYSQEIAIAINADSVALLAGLTIDFSEDLMGGGFRFHNPNATTTCGCGLSFTT